MNAKSKKPGEVTYVDPDGDLVEQAAELVDEGSVMLVDTATGEMKPLTPAPQQSTALASVDRLLELAVTGNADMAKLEKLLDLKERYDKEEARKAYTAAMAAFKAEAPIITKDKKVSYGHKDGDGKTEYWHATLGNIVNLAVPVMARHGLSHHWDQERDGDRVKVRCSVTHSAGHRESTDWWPGPLDATGKKNPIQQAASTVTYLERYTFLLITGLAVEEQDDDGAAGAPDPEPVEYIDVDQQNTIHSLITDNNLDMEKFLTWLATSAVKSASIEDIQAEYYDRVIKKINATIKAQQS